MSTLATALAGPAPLLLDGGLGTMLIASGLPAGHPPEEWVEAHPDRLQAVHRAYVEAGSEVVHAATFGANPIRLARHGLESRVGEINRRAVQLARGAGARFVLADVGPTGEYLPPVGNGDLARWREAFLRQARALLETEVDGLHLETFSDLREARVALEAIGSLRPRILVFASLTFDRKRRGFFTIMGDPLAGSLRALAEAGASVVGANCTLASGDLKALAEEAIAAGLPLVLQPNAGQPRRDGNEVRYDQTPEEFATDMLEIAALSAGAGPGRIAALGGCCGTDPRFIRALAVNLGRAPRSA